MDNETLINKRYYELLSEDDKFNLLVVKDLEINELKEKLTILENQIKTLQASQDQSKLLLADIRKSVCKWEKKCDFIDKDGCCEIPDECKYKQTVC